MRPRISIITLGVKDLPASIAFYKKLGFKLETEENTEHIAFFLLEGAGARLALFPADALAEDAGVPPTFGVTPRFTLAHNVASPEAVDKTLADVAALGAKIVKPGQATFWGGYSGYFSDPDGFLWEIAFNPFSPELAN